ncbi:MAG TPA: hypothetical protein VHW23_40595, partial [Kofleriaceae bacterium]|nr:hypothetical protein [Kofleriaceae bacterium]
MAVAARLAAALRDPRRARWIRGGAIALGAAAIAWGFAFAVLRHTWPMGLPLDDSYLDLTYARQIGRGQPFRYFSGGGFSAGATSPLWPVVLAPLWTLGARGHALVWAAFVVSAGLYAATALAAARVVRSIAGAGGGLAAVLVLAVPAFAWAALSGTDVALTAALVAVLLALLAAAPASGAPPARLVACLAAVTLTRPEAAVIAIAIAVAGAAGRVCRRELAAAARWLAALAPLAVWLALHRGLAGHWLPSRVLATSHIGQPGFDAAHGWRAVGVLTARMVRGVFWSADSPLVWPRAIAALWLAGAVRVAAWARRERRSLAGAAIVGAPVIVLLAAIASSERWEIHNGCSIALAFPLIAITAGVALMPSPRGSPRLRRLHAIAAAVGIAGYGVAAVPRMVADARLFAQGVADTNRQGVAIGAYVQRKLPGATVVVRDAGAIGYYSDGPIYDLDGRVTDEATGVAGHGPGARFELLERLAERGFSHFAVDPGRIGTTEFFGEDLYHARLGPRLDPRSLGGDRDLQLLAARWDHAGSGERPVRDHAGWAIADRIDVADLDSEAAHGWSGALGPRQIGDPATRWSFVGREAGAHGLVLDGGRTIRGGAERFAIAIDPARPVQLVLRTGGARTYADQEPIEHVVLLRILDDTGREL